MDGRAPTANQIRGRATGSLFFGGFGTLWIVLALYIKQLVTPLTVGLISAELAALLAVIFWLFHRSRVFAKVPEDPGQSKSFNRINTAQWAAIAIVTFSFSKLHWNDFALSVVAGIVGLHLFPLARLFHYRMHYVTGAALVAWAIVSAAFLPRDQIQGTTALGTGILLSLSAWVTLLLAVRTALSRN